MKKLRDIIEGVVIQFPSSLAKRKKTVLGGGQLMGMNKSHVDEHEILEKHALSHKGKFEDPKNAIKAAEPLLNHLRDKHGIAIMQDGVAHHADHFLDDLVNFSHGMRIAKNKGAEFKTYPPHQVYMRQHRNTGFEDGYSGHTGIKIRLNASPDEIGHFLHGHMASQNARFDKEREENRARMKKYDDEDASST